MAVIISLMAPAIIIATICSYIVARRTSISRRLTMVAGSLTAFLTTVTIGTGGMLVGRVLQTEEARRHQKLTFLEGWALFVLLYGGAALIAGGCIALICLSLVRKSHPGSRQG